MSEPNSPHFRQPPTTSAEFESPTTSDLFESVVDEPLPAVAEPATPPSPPAPAGPRRRWLRWLAALAVTCVLFAVAFNFVLAPLILRTALVELLSAKGRGKAEVAAVEYRFPLGVAVRGVRVWAAGHDDKPPVLEIADAQAELGSLPLPGRKLVIRQAHLSPKLTLTELPSGDNTLTVWIDSLRAALSSESPEPEARTQKTLSDVLKIGEFQLRDAAVVYVQAGETEDTALAVRDVNLTLRNDTDDERFYDFKLDGEIGPFGQLALRSRLDLADLILTVQPGSEVTLTLTDDRVARLPKPVQNLLAAFRPRGQLTIGRSRAELRFRELSASTWHAELNLTEASVFVPGVGLDIRQGRCDVVADHEQGLAATVSGQTNHGRATVTASLGVSEQHPWKLTVEHAESGFVRAEGTLAQAGSAADGGGGDWLLEVRSLSAETDLSRSVFAPLLPRSPDGRPLLTGVSGQVTLAGSGAANLSAVEPIRAELTVTARSLGVHWPDQQLTLREGRLSAAARLPSAKAPMMLSLEAGAESLTLAGQSFAQPSVSAQSSWDPKKTDFPTGGKLTATTQFGGQEIGVSAVADYRASEPSPFTVGVTLAGSPIVDGQGSVALHQPRRTLTVAKLAVRLADPKPVLAALPVGWRGGLNVATVEGRVRVDGRAVLELTPFRVAEADAVATAEGLSVDLPTGLGRVTDGSLLAEFAPGRLTLKSAAGKLGELSATLSAVAEADPNFDLLGKPIRVRDVSATVRTAKAEAARLTAQTELALGSSRLTVPSVELWADLGALWAGLPTELRQRLPADVAGDLDRLTFAGTAQLDAGATLSWADGRVTASAASAKLRATGLGVDLGPTLGRLADGELTAELREGRLAVKSARVQTVPSAGEAPLVATLGGAAEFAPGLDLTAPVRLTGLAAQVRTTPTGTAGATETVELLGVEADAEWRHLESRLSVTARRGDCDLGRLWRGVPAKWRQQLPAELAKLDPTGRASLTGSATLELGGDKPIREAELSVSLREGGADLAGLLPGGGRLRDAALSAKIRPGRATLERLTVQHAPAVGDSAKPLTATLSGQAEFDAAGDLAKPIRLSELRAELAASADAPSVVSVRGGRAELRLGESRLTADLGETTADVAGLLAGLPRGLLPTELAGALADASGRVKLTGGLGLSLASGRPIGVHAVAEFADISAAVPKNDAGEYRLSGWRGRVVAVDGPNGELIVDLLETAGGLTRGPHRVDVGGVAARLTLTGSAVAVTARADATPLGPLTAVLVGGGRLPSPNGSTEARPAPWELAVQARPTLDEGLRGLLPEELAAQLTELSASGELPIAARLRWPSEGRVRAELAAVVRDAKLTAAGVRVSRLSAAIRGEPGLRTFRVSDLSADVAAPNAAAGNGQSPSTPPPGWLVGSAELTLPAEAVVGSLGGSLGGRLAATLRFGGLPVPPRYLTEVPTVRSVRLDGTLTAALPLDALGDAWRPTDAVALSDGRLIIEHAHPGTPTTLRTFAAAGLALRVLRDPVAGAGPARFLVRDGRIAELLGGSAEFAGELDVTAGVYTWRVPKMPLNLRPADALSLPVVGEQLDTASRPVGALSVVAAGEYRKTPPTGEPKLTWKLERAELANFSTRLGKPELRATQVAGVLTGDHRAVRSEQITATVAEGRATLTNVRLGLPVGKEKPLTYAADVRAENVSLKALLDAGKRPGLPGTTARGTIALSMSVAGDADRGADGLTITDGKAELRRARFLGLPIFNNIRGACQKLIRLTPFGDSLDQQADLVFRMADGEFVLERGLFSDPLATMIVRRARVTRRRADRMGPQVSAWPDADKPDWAVDAEVSVAPLNRELSVVGDLIGLGLSLGGKQAAGVGETISELIQSELLLDVTGPVRDPEVKTREVRKKPKEPTP